MSGVDPNVSIVLADDHTLVRRSIGAMLQKSPGVRVVADVGTSEAAIDACLQHHPTLVVLDVDMPGLGVFDAARTIRARCERTTVVFLSAHTHDRYIESALDVGARGYITKGEPPEAVVAGLRAIASGKEYFSPDVRERLSLEGGRARLAGGTRTRASMLTPREVEVLTYVARGLTKKEIAKTMHLSVKTIENHASNIMKRLDIHDRVELARFAIREGLVQA